jgi:hypothetical protein
MAASAALRALEPPDVDEPMIKFIVAGTAEPNRPTSLLQSSLTLLLGAVEPLEAWQSEKPFWKWIPLCAMTTRVFMHDSESPDGRRGANWVIKWWDSGPRASRVSAKHHN